MRPGKFLKSALKCAVGGIGKVAVLLLLITLGLVGVSVARRFLAAPEPHVDFTRHAREPHAWETPASDDADTLRFAVATMVSAEETFATYRLLAERIGRDVGNQETFVVRPSYVDVREELERGTIDVALVCTGTYVHALPNKRIRLLVQPEFKEGLAYKCEFIVPARSSYQTIEDLRGSVMAFTDPESNTGCLVPTAMLLRRNLDPRTFFKKVLFTGSHDRSISAVALGIVDVASVDSLVLESKLSRDAALAGELRVIWQSEALGPPPVVVRADIDRELEDALREAFLTLDEDEDGRAILQSIGIERFVEPLPGSYQSVVEMYEYVQQSGDIEWP